jgi:hypothetical protein
MGILPEDDVEDDRELTAVILRWFERRQVRPAVVGSIGMRLASCAAISIAEANPKNTTAQERKALKKFLRKKARDWVQVTLKAFDVV